jgi:hypothetical protein
MQKDTPLRRFGTVRPLVQIPGPRPISSSKSSISDDVGTREVTAVSQIFLELGGGSPRFMWIADRRLKPAHGYRTADISTRTPTDRASRVFDPNRTRRRHAASCILLAYWLTIPSELWHIRFGAA